MKEAVQKTKATFSVALDIDSIKYFRLFIKKFSEMP